MRNSRLTRRRLLFAAGSGVLGVAVVNTFTGCSSPSASPKPEDSDTPAAGGVVGDWHRVELSIVSAYLLVRGGEAAIVDLGVEGSADAIESVLKAAGSGWSSVRHIILTHQHADHVGGLAGVAPKVNATIYAGEADVDSISSVKPLKPVKDGDEIFGFQIIGTPGHTMGHVSVFEPSTGVLVAGDALRTFTTVAGSDPQYTADPLAAADSVRKLAKLDVKAILPGHGEPLTKGVGDDLRKLAASLPAN